MSRFWLLSGAIYSFLAVIFGAFGAHALKQSLSSHGQSLFQTGVEYQMFHAIGLFLVGLMHGINRKVDFNISGWSFMLGIILFSGSLYFMALTGAKWLGMITPFGGISFLIGWGWMITCLLKIKQN